jgi:hypothetical protein
MVRQTEVTRRRGLQTLGRRRRSPRRAAVVAAAAVCLLLTVGVVEPVLGQAWEANLTILCGSASANLRLGQHPAATLGLDGALGEYELPPLPPSGSFDARFTDAGLGNGTAVDVRPFDATRTDTLVIAIQWAGGTRVVRWDAAKVAASTARASMADLRGGQLGVDVDLRSVGEVVITNPRVDCLWLIIQSAPVAVDSTAAVQRFSWGELKAEGR